MRSIRICASCFACGIGFHMVLLPGWGWTYLGGLISWLTGITAVSYNWKEDDEKLS